MNAETQVQMYYAAVRHAAECDRTFLDMVNCASNPLTREDLAALIQRRPALWGRYAGWLDNLPARGAP